MIDSLLQSIENVITLSTTEKDIVLSLFKEKTYKKGDFFLEEWNTCKQVGYVTKGLLRYFINHNGEDKLMTLLKKTILFATMKALYLECHPQKIFRP